MLTKVSSLGLLLLFLNLISTICSATEIANLEGEGGLQTSSTFFNSSRNHFSKSYMMEGMVGESGGVPDAFVTSLAMILVTEVGDETFIIAALLAMRHSRAIVLAGALSALVVMTVLSTALGFVLPNVISKKHTNRAATVLYSFFGLRLLYIAWRAKGGAAPVNEEIEEVEDKLGTGVQNKSATRRFFARLFTPVFLEAFILTFLAEWGDRSQIATIALAAHKDPVGVTVGAILGHTLCTSLAVVGGRLLAMRISQRTVAAIGGFLFLGFAVHSHFYPPLS
ncbi:hypothetical protein KFL_011750020 [Klebsormidium nitens]|uniref:GDT1 family protein n=1 Tax=Klebsormidium nitens TaxID=105231 RepID=A0A1Y1ITH1_KLENI|nr:hypothetical protein KFL_011750020 [Klebsormidium nitens]|eukprot:GAQ92869.1 hypothetical protein KFL_011750020 [Klebsormidium nitens]